MLCKRGQLAVPALATNPLQMDVAGSDAGTRLGRLIEEQRWNRGHEPAVWNPEGSSRAGREPHAERHHGAVGFRPAINKIHQETWPKRQGGEHKNHAYTPLPVFRRLVSHAGTGREIMRPVRAKREIPMC